MKKENQELKHKFKNVIGSISVDELKIVSVSSQKHATVKLCIKSNMHIPFAQIRLYDTNLLQDAEATFESAKILGEEIEKRWTKSAQDKPTCQPEGEFVKRMLKKYPPPNDPRIGGMNHWEDIWRLCHHITRLKTSEEERERLKEFARHVIRQECWSIFPQDGGELQDLAEKLGLIVKHIATEDDIDEDSDYEVGDTIYQFAQALKDVEKGIIQSFDPQTKAAPTDSAEEYCCPDPDGCKAFKDTAKMASRIEAQQILIGGHETVKVIIQARLKASEEEVERLRRILKTTVGTLRQTRNRLNQKDISSHEINCLLGIIQRDFSQLLNSEAEQSDPQTKAHEATGHM